MPPPFPLSPIAFPQHADQNSSEGPVLLAVHQDLGEGSSLRVGPEVDPFGAPHTTTCTRLRSSGVGWPREGR